MQRDQNDLFFVHVVESPSSLDLLDGRTEGRVLIEALNLSGVPATYNLVTSSETLDLALGERLNGAHNYWQRFPILHFSLHGDKEGVYLTNKPDEPLRWRELRQKLLPINQHIGEGLIVCLSSCFGDYGSRMAMYENEPLPFLALVGHLQSPTWSDAAVGFVSFYHRLRKGATLSEAVDAMKIASGDFMFNFRKGHEIHEGYVQYLRRKRLDEKWVGLSAYLREQGARPTPGRPQPSAEAL